MPYARAETFARGPDRPIEQVIYRIGPQQRLHEAQGFDGALAALSAHFGAPERPEAEGVEVGISGTVAVGVVGGS